MILRVIYEMVKWAKEGNIIEQNLPNPYGNAAASIKKVGKRQKPQLVQDVNINAAPDIPTEQVNEKKHTQRG